MVQKRSTRCEVGEKKNIQKRVDKIVRNEKLSIMYANVDGICSKIDEFKEMVAIQKPDVICLAESKLNQAISDQVIVCKGYDIWRKDRVGKNGGGVLIMTSKKLKVLLNYMNDQDNTELLAVDIIGEDVTKIVVVYVPPKTRSWSKEELHTLQEQTISGLETIIKQAEKKSNNLVITGDMNCNLGCQAMQAEGDIKWNEKVSDLLQNYFLTQHVDKKY